MPQDDMLQNLHAAPRRRHWGGPRALVPSLARAFNRTVGGMTQELHGPDGARQKLIRVCELAHALGRQDWLTSYLRPLLDAVYHYPRPAYDPALERLEQRADAAEDVSQADFLTAPAHDLAALDERIRTLDQSLLRQQTLRDALLGMRERLQHGRPQR